MNGAEAILRTGAQAGIRVCFCNPGSTELEMLNGFDAVHDIRPVLGLQENVCTGMADGYGRLAERPAFTLLHQGAGLSNGSANLHNAKKAPSPIVNLVGTNAERSPDLTPLASDVLGLARPVSHWCGVSTSSQSVAAETAAAIEAAMHGPGQVATLVLPAASQSGPASGPAETRSYVSRAVAGDAIERAARALHANGKAVALMLHARAMTPRGLAAAARIATATGCALFTEPIPRRWERGAGRPVLRVVPSIMPGAALETLKPFGHLVLVGSQAPQPYFLLADTPAPLVPAGCDVMQLGDAGDDLAAALEALADDLKAPAQGVVQQLQRPAIPSGPLTATAINSVVGALMPDNAIIVQTSTSGARDFLPLTQGCPPHSVLANTGASIGWGLPAAGGAALACPDRAVISLAADGGELMTIQALWSHAREGLNVTTIVFCNREYKILRNELEKHTPDPGPRANSLLGLRQPDIDYCQLARGFGVPATRPSTIQELQDDFARALAEPGPHLIEVLT